MKSAGGWGIDLWNILEHKGEFESLFYEGSQNK